MKRALNAPVILSAVLALISIFLLARLAGVLFMAPAGLVQAASQQSGGSPSTGSAPGHGIHSITVKFDYDFGRTPACTEKILKHCTEIFVVYDISAGATRRSKLFTIPVPEGAKGQVKGITATSPELDFESGRHELAVAAQEPSGLESNNYAATVWIVIP